MYAARAQPGEMPLADQQPRRQGLLLLRERTSQRTALLPGARAHRLSAGRHRSSAGAWAMIRPPRSPRRRERAPTTRGRARAPWAVFEVVTLQRVTTTVVP